RFMAGCLSISVSLATACAQPFEPPPDNETGTDTIDHGGMPPDTVVNDGDGAGRIYPPILRDVGGLVQPGAMPGTAAPSRDAIVIGAPRSDPSNVEDGGQLSILIETDSGHLPA